MRAIRAACSVVLVLVLGTLISSSLTPKDAGAARQRATTHVMKFGAAGDTTAAGIRKTFDGGPEDSIQTGTNWATDWVPIVGARSVVLMIRDSLTTAGGPYIDSLGSAQVHLSYDKTNYVAFNLSSFTPQENDSFLVAFVGKWLGLHLSGGQTGVQFPGYLTVSVVPHDLSTGEVSLPHLQWAWIRVVIQPAQRFRCTTCTGNASMIGVRILARVFYDDIVDSYLGTAED